MVWETKVLSSAAAAAAAAAAADLYARLPRVLAHLGEVLQVGRGRIVISEIEKPNMFVNLV